MINSMIFNFKSMPDSWGQRMLVPIQAQKWQQWSHYLQNLRIQWHLQILVPDWWVLSISFKQILAVNSIFALQLSMMMIQWKNGVSVCLTVQLRKWRSCARHLHSFRPSVILWSREALITPLSKRPWKTRSWFPEWTTFPSPVQRVMCLKTPSTEPIMPSAWTTPWFKTMIQFEDVSVSYTSP